MANKLISADKIAKTVEELCVEANLRIRKDILLSMKNALSRETGLAKKMFRILIENAAIARKSRLPLCQDTGMVIVFIEIGKDIRITGDIEKAVNSGIRKAYKGKLRASVVSDPLLRENTRDNTPGIIYYSIKGSKRLKIRVCIKGFGSENASQVKMFKPTSEKEEIRSFVVDVVKAAGAAACPPLILGVGIGGTFDKVTMLAKEALLRPIGKPNTAPHIARLEKEILRAVNRLGIGPMGLGGKTTALGVNIAAYPTHIAGLPVAVNVGCHSLRSAERTLA